MGQIKIEFKKDSLDNELSKLIIGRVKNILRNDNILSRLIEETVNIEVKRRVNVIADSRLIEREVKRAIDKKLHEVDLQVSSDMEIIKSDVKRELSKELKRDFLEEAADLLVSSTYDTLVEERNKRQIASLLKTEIDEVKSQPIAGESCNCEYCRRVTHETDPSNRKTIMIQTSENAKIGKVKKSHEDEDLKGGAAI